MMNKRCTHISSFGSLRHFKSECKPPGAGSRYLDCAVESTCPYSAKSMYLDLVESGHQGWPVDVIVNGEPTPASVRQALEEGPYGRCVYECDNDVVDNQVVNMQFEDGSTASFSMIAFTKEQCVRKTRIFGSHGAIQGDGIDTIECHNFLTGETVNHVVEMGSHLQTSLTNHGFGDYYVIHDFINAVSHGDQSFILSGTDEALESHLMVFRAEQSRHESSVVSLDW